MTKKSTDGEMGASTLSHKLSKTNYRVWSMTMEVYLDSHDLWQTIVGENPRKKKDRLALSAIISCVPEDLLGILNVKKTAKENWEILRQRNPSVYRVIQSRIRGLRCDGFHHGFCDEVHAYHLQYEESRRGDGGEEGHANIFESNAGQI